MSDTEPLDRFQKQIILFKMRSRCHAHRLKCSRELIGKLWIVNCREAKVRQGVDVHLSCQFTHAFEADIEVAVDPAASGRCTASVYVARLDDIESIRPCLLVLVAASEMTCAAI